MHSFNEAMDLDRRPTYDCENERLPYFFDHVKRLNPGQKKFISCSHRNQIQFSDRIFHLQLVSLKVGWVGTVVRQGEADASLHKKWTANI